MSTTKCDSKRMKKESKNNKDDEEKKEDIFSQLDLDCQRDILSFLLTIPNEIDDGVGNCQGRELKRNIYNLIQVSKLWCSLTSEGINQHAPEKNFLFKVENLVEGWARYDYGRLFEQHFTVEGTARQLWEEMNEYHDHCFQEALVLFENVRASENEVIISSIRELIR